MKVGILQMKLKGVRYMYPFFNENIRYQKQEVITTQKIGSHFETGIHEIYSNFRGGY